MTTAIRDLGSNVFQQDQRMTGARPTPILHLIETGGPGGAERIILDIAENLDPRYLSIIGLLKTGWVSSQAMMRGLRLVMIDARSFGDLSILLRLLRLIRQCEVVLIHAHEFYMSGMGALVSRLTGVPLVITVHGKGYYPDRRRRRMIYRLAAAQAKGVVAVSQDLREFFCRTIKIPTEHVRVIYNGIPCRPYSSTVRDPILLESAGIPRDATIIGTLGNLYPVKGHVYLIRAARIILQHRPDIHVVILGRGAEESVLRAEAKSLGIENRIHLLGYRNDASRWLATMNVFTLPSLSEGLPLSLLEAMAAGIPPVVTDVGGMPEVIRDGETGFIVPPRNPEAMALKIRCLLEDSQVAATLAAAGQRQVRQRFSLEAMLAQYTSLYQEVLTPYHTSDESAASAIRDESLLGTK